MVVENEVINYNPLIEVLADRVVYVSLIDCDFYGTFIEAGTLWLGTIPHYAGPSSGSPANGVAMFAPWSKETGLLLTSCWMSWPQIKSNKNFAIYTDDIENDGVTKKIQTKGLTKEQILEIMNKDIIW